MNSSARAPTTDELLAMAYADGELTPEAERAFETRLAREDALRVLVADQRRIAVLAREAAPSEPLELASLAIERGTSLALLAVAGRAFLVLALLWTLVWLALACFENAPQPPIAGAALTFALGLGLLAVRALLVRRGTVHLDPYRDLRR